MNRKTMPRMLMGMDSLSLASLARASSALSMAARMDADLARSWL